MMSSGTERLVSQLPQPTRPPNSYDLSFQVQPEEALEHNYMNSGRHREHIIAGEGRVRDLLKSEVEGMFSKLENKGGLQDNKDIQSRGIHDHDSSRKLERFKVRTVVAEEVVKEEDKK